MKKIADKIKNFAADSSYSAHIKKCVLWVTAISLSSGMSLGSFLDGIFLSRSDYPYRAPFDEIIWLVFLLASIILWIRYIIFVCKYPNDTGYMIAELLISLIGSLMLTVVISFIWIFAIGMVHDIKIAIGLSHP
ncbi:MAG: hypothetical protein ACI4J0_05140 [Huintestinicola sp.]|uniref:hypothetical protein n=1 Tax=Huintestinicola sp. TaxID=2981661 RepID=UPI003F04E623